MFVLFLGDGDATFSGEGLRMELLMWSGKGRRFTYRFVSEIDMRSIGREPLRRRILLFSVFVCVFVSVVGSRRFRSTP